MTVADGATRQAVDQPCDLPSECDIISAQELDSEYRQTKTPFSIHDRSPGTGAGKAPALGGPGPELLDNSRVYVRFLPFVSGRVHLQRLLVIAILDHPLEPRDSVHAPMWVHIPGVWSGQKRWKRQRVRQSDVPTLGDPGEALWTTNRRVSTDAAVMAGPSISRIKKNIFFATKRGVTSTLPGY